MSKLDPAESRRKILLAGGAGLLGITSAVGAWMAKARGRRSAQAEARRLASRIDLPKGAGSMMEAYARDPEKVKRFRELTQWREMRDKELGNV